MYSIKSLRGVFVSLWVLAQFTAHSQENIKFSDYMNSIKSESDPLKMEVTMLELETKKEVLTNESNKELIDFCRGHVADAFAETGDVAKVKYWLSRMENERWKQSSVMAVTEKLIELRKLDAADSIMQPYLKMNELGLALKNGDMWGAPLTQKDFEYKHGVILYYKGQYKKAIPYLTPPQQESTEKAGAGFQEPEIYAMALVAVGEKQKAEPLVTSLILGTGERSSDFTASAKKLYAGLYGNDAYYNNLVDSAAMLEKKRVLAKISPMMTNEPAPAFKITDVNGKTVSLESLKGKIVILDFWATWCIPCVASFPAMQKAVNYYAKDTSVVFMFIHTQERGPKSIDDAKNLLKAKKYTFDLYMDLRNPDTKKNSMSDAFQVRGLPTKFVINRDGVIKFKNTGYLSVEEAIGEISAMVEIANNPQ